MSERDLSLEELIRWAKEHTTVLYDGREVPHRSCGIALAETFGVATMPYQALRRGGITGKGECGAIKAGELILGEVFGDPDPTGNVTDELRRAARIYREHWEASVDTGSAQTIVCNDLTAQFGDFHSPERHAFCTRLSGTVAECVARTILELGADVTPREVPDS